MTEIKTVRLKNGADEVDMVVRGLLITLNDLLNKEPIAFYEAVMLARNPDHRLFSNCGAILERHAILGQGRMHDSTRNVILSAVIGEDFDMRLVSPLASAKILAALAKEGE